jgi:hypothetical protein
MAQAGQDFLIIYARSQNANHKLNCILLLDRKPVPKCNINYNSRSEECATGKSAYDACPRQNSLLQAT